MSLFIYFLANKIHVLYKKYLQDETRAKITEMKTSVQREQQAFDAEVGRDASEAAEWNKELQETRDRLEALVAEQRNHTRVEQELEFWEKQNEA